MNDFRYLMGVHLPGGAPMQPLTIWAEDHEGARRKAADIAKRLHLSPKEVDPHPRNLHGAHYELFVQIEP